MVKLLTKGRSRAKAPSGRLPFRGDEVNVVVPAYFQRKAPWCRVLGILLLIAFSPAILLCMALVRLSSRGPAIYRQTRVGKDQKPFRLYKIRTMFADCENVSGPVLCQPGDSRITPVGRVLRFLHLDELPQLINVARGEMCLVGPRPERPEIILRHKLNENVPGFSQRTRVLPGVTGLAQINLPADISVECVKPKVQLDLEYIETASFGLDLRILLCTAFRMVGVRHGRAVHLLGLGRSFSIDLPPAVGTNGVMHPAHQWNGATNGHSTNGSPQLAMVTGNGAAGSAAEWQSLVRTAEDDTLPKQPR